MKRKHFPTDCDDFEEAVFTRKRFSRAPPTKEYLPCKFKLFRPWELTEEVSRYLSLKNRVNSNQMDDRTNPQLAIVPYEPNPYQRIIDGITSWPHEYYYEPEPMDIEEIEVYGSWLYTSFCSFSIVIYYFRLLLTWILIKVKWSKVEVECEDKKEKDQAVQIDVLKSRWDWANYAIAS